MPRPPPKPPAIRTIRSISRAPKRWFPCGGSGLPPEAGHGYESVMLRPLIIALALTATPALAAVDRATAVSTLAGLYNSADVCNLSISRAKVDAYRDANAPAGDPMFNVDVFQATHALYDQQKG